MLHYEFGFFQEILPPALALNFFRKINFNFFFLPTMARIYRHETVNVNYSADSVQEGAFNWVWVYWPLPVL